MNRKKKVLTYIIFDILTASASWAFFFIFRKVVIESHYFGYPVPVRFSSTLALGLILLPVFWCILYYLAGFYRDVCRRSRLKELGVSLLVTIIGSLIIFFALILNDVIINYRNYYASLSVLAGIHFVLSYLPRLAITSATLHKIRTGKIGFNTLIIGANSKAREVYRSLSNQPFSSGNRIIGFLHVNENSMNVPPENVPHLGGMDNLKEVIARHAVEEVIIAIESEEHKRIEDIINKLECHDVIIKVIPSLYDILTGKVRFTSRYDTPLIQVSRELMPVWQAGIKRCLDIVISLTGLVVSMPVLLVVAVLIRAGSRGPVIYSHERIGRYSKPFRIYKLRSMVEDAEKDGPMLSKKDDPRITPVGRFIRRTRIDEIPNFVNVIRGEMSLVGPRPERKFFIDQILVKAPHYIHLLKVKPGLTSWGQVMFGYAENVDEMVERLKYDLMYIENMSLYIDFKIMAYTLITVLKRKGR